MFKVQMRTMRTMKKAMPLATRRVIMTGNSQNPEMKSVLHSFQVLLQLRLNSSYPIIMHFREKRLLLFTSFRTGHFCFISRMT